MVAVDDGWQRAEILISRDVLQCEEKGFWRTKQCLTLGIYVPIYNSKSILHKVDKINCVKSKIVLYFIIFG